MINVIRIFLAFFVVCLLIGSYQIWNEGMSTPAVVGMSFLWVLVGFVGYKFLPKKNQDGQN